MTRSIKPAALGRPDVNKRLDDLGYIAVGNRPEQMGPYIKSEIDKYARLIRQIGLPLE
jgi:tripartite-type tricarboxylate transporter receptor subunit TctC